MIILNEGKAKKEKKLNVIQQEMQRKKKERLRNNSFK